MKKVMETIKTKVEVFGKMEDKYIITILVLAFVASLFIESAYNIGYNNSMNYDQISSSEFYVGNYFKRDLKRTIDGYEDCENSYLIYNPHGENGYDWFLCSWPEEYVREFCSIEYGWTDEQVEEFFRDGGSQIIHSEYRS